MRKFAQYVCCLVNCAKISNYQRNCLHALMMFIKKVKIIRKGKMGGNNIIYISKVCLKKSNFKKYAVLGSTIMLIISVLFIVLVGIFTVIVQMMKMTAIPFLMLVISIVQYVLIAKMK